MNEKITGSNCMDCIHNSVCSYRESFLDICNAVTETNVMKQVDDKRMSSKKVTLYDILDGIVIKCKYYHKDTPTPRYQDIITTVTNPCGISTSTSAITPQNTPEITPKFYY